MAIDFARLPRHPRSMCNRARLSSEPETLREKFGAKWGALILNAWPIELYPKAIAPVIREINGERIVDGMRWGVLGDDKAVKGVGTNVRQLDKWRWLTSKRGNRCLIPVSEFCEQTEQRFDLGDGKPALKGQMWFAATDQPVFAIAGFWQRLGSHDHFAMVTCDPNELVAPIHPKAMVTILAPEDWERWMAGDQALLETLQRPYPADRMTMRGPEFPTRKAI